jgi:hypothetical protein
LHDFWSIVCLFLSSLFSLQCFFCVLVSPTTVIFLGMEQDFSYLWSKTENKNVLQSWLLALAAACCFSFGGSYSLCSNKVLLQNIQVLNFSVNLECNLYGTCYWILPCSNSVLLQNIQVLNFSTNMEYYLFRTWGSNPNIQVISSCTNLEYNLDRTCC